MSGESVETVGFVSSTFVADDTLSDANGSDKIASETGRGIGVGLWGAIIVMSSDKGREV